jgi:hypothetical protein
VFVEEEDGRFALTPMAAALGREAGPLWLQVLVLGHDTSWRAAGGLLHTVRTGEPAFTHVHGVDFFAYYRQHPDEGARFDQLMAAATAPQARAVAAAYDFAPFGTIVDVGGGQGALLLAILATSPRPRGIVFDQPVVAEGARQVIAAAGLADRCEAVGGDFFAGVPAGGDVYLLKYILHDWDDARCVAILRHCRRAMRDDGRLLVVEQLIPPGNAPSFAKTIDISMLINLTGRERPEAEYKTLLAAAGFRLTRAAPAQGELHILEGIPT